MHTVCFVWKQFKSQFIWTVFKYTFPINVQSTLYCTLIYYFILFKDRHAITHQEKTPEH
jgi:hypothetical protein